MVEYYTHRGNISFFIILNFEEPPILYPLSMHDTHLTKTFQSFTAKFRDTEKKNFLNFASLISKDSILWEHDFVNGETSEIITPKIKRVQYDSID